MPRAAPVPTHQGRDREIADEINKVESQVTAYFRSLDLR